MIRHLGFALLLAFLVPASAQTERTPVAPPDRISYTGLLTDADGAALDDGTRQLTFRAYATAEDARLGGAPVWEEAHDAVTLDGRFVVVLGSKAPLSADATWLTIAVDGEAPTAPALLSRAGAAQAGGIALDDAYEAGNLISVDSGSPVLFRGTAGASYTGLIVRDLTAVFLNDELTRFRLRSVNGGETWEYRVYGSLGANDGATPAGTFAIANSTSQPAPDVFQIFPDAGESLLRLTGSGVLIGDGANPTELRAFTTDNPGGPGTGVVGLLVRDWFGTGTSLELHEEGGSKFFEVQPDADGTGGYLQIKDGSGGVALEVDGNRFGSGDAVVEIGNGAGASRFDTGGSGSETVQLPASAIESAEILDEAGAANNRNGSTLFLETGFNLTLSQTITAPSDGFVIALGTGEVLLNHVTGTTSSIQLSVADGLDCDATPGAPTSQQTNITLPSGAATGPYRYTSTVQGLFAVAAGVNTFCITALEGAGTDAQIDDQNLTLLFVPTSYGSVSSNLTPAGAREDERTAALAAPGSPMTAADVAAQREASVAANEARILAELEAMRARIDELEREAGNGRGGE